MKYSRVRTPLAAACVVVIVTGVLFARVPTAFASVTRYEQNSPAVAYAPYPTSPPGLTWNFNVPGAGLSGGSYTWWNSAGTATFTFSGSKVDWIGRRQLWFGIAQVSLDGGGWQNVDLYSTVDYLTGVVWSSPTVANGPHTLAVRWTGTQDPASTQGVYGGGVPPYNTAALVAIDAFDVYTPQTITASAGSGGAISPSGATAVNYGANQTFAITPNAGQHIQDVLKDGVSIGASGSVTFTNVTADHTISASFAANPTSTPASSGWSLALGLVAGLAAAGLLVRSRGIRA